MRYQHTEPTRPSSWTTEDLKQLKAMCGKLESFALNFDLLDSMDDVEMLELALDIGTLVRKHVR